MILSTWNLLNVAYFPASEECNFLKVHYLWEKSGTTNGEWNSPIGIILYLWTWMDFCSWLTRCRMCFLEAHVVTTIMFPARKLRNRNGILFAEIPKALMMMLCHPYGQLNACGEKKVLTRRLLTKKEQIMCFLWEVFCLYIIPVTRLFMEYMAVISLCI